MTEQYIVSPFLEVRSAHQDAYELVLAGMGRTLSADEYQLQLLLRFEEPATISSMLDAYPFHRAASTAFLESCVAEQFLLPADARGRPRLPALRRVEPTMMHTPHARPEDPSAFTFAGIPFDTNTTGSPGARFGPLSVRQAADGCRYGLDPVSLSPRGFIDFSSGRTMLKGVTFSDAGDVEILTGEDPTATYDRITDVASALVESGTLPIFIGGDHSITYPIVRALPYDEIGIIHFDAHTDLGDVEPAGLHHGNVFTLILERLEFVTSVHQIGLRGLYEADPDHGHKRVTWFGMDAVRSSGPEALLAQIPEGRPYYLSVDIDVLDPSFAPSTGTPVACGMFPHELKGLVRAVAEARDLVGMDIVEVGPSLGAHDSTAGIAVEVALAMADGTLLRLSRAAVQEEET